MFKTDIKWYLANQKKYKHDIFNWQSVACPVLCKQWQQQQSLKVRQLFGYPAKLESVLVQVKCIEKRVRRKEEREANDTTVYSGATFCWKLMPVSSKEMGGSRSDKSEINEKGFTGEIITNHLRHAKQSLDNYHSTLFYYLTNRTIRWLKLMKFLAVF